LKPARHDRKFWHACILAAGALSLVGCGRGSEVSGTDYQANRQLSLIAEMYGNYMQEHGGAPPKDEAAFKTFLAKYAARRLEPYNVESVDELLVSPRDEQPFVVVYGKKLVSKDAPNAPWAAYEHTGVDGKRLAVQVRGVLEEYPPDEFSAKVPVK
jgi:hypothetical protein